MIRNLDYSATGGGGSDAPRFLLGGGEMGALLRAHDWSQSSIGPPSQWSQSLRTVVRLMLNTGHPMFVFAGGEGACLYNDAYRLSLGPERHPGAIGRPARAVWGEIWHIIGPQIEQVMSGGGATWHVNHLVPSTRHGKLEDVYWTYSYSPIDDETAPGGIGGVLVVCSETTQQVAAARRLADERDQLAQLFEQAPIFMAMLAGPEHRFEMANPGYLQLVGHRPVLGRTTAEALPEAIEQGYVTLLDQVFASAKAYIATGAKYTIHATTGGPPVDRYVDFVYQPINGADGVVTGIFVLGADVTDRARADEALRESMDRFRDLAEQLGESNRQKDEFLATLAHELRNPLAPIRTALELLKLAPADSDVATAAREVMDRQVTQVVRLVDDLLDLSRVSRGLIELRKTRVPLARLLEDAVETSRPVIEQAGHTLTVVAPDPAIMLEADPTRLIQVLANLLNNAAKFTPRGGHIELSSVQDGADVVVSVRDNGVGISPALLERVFEMFTQVGRSHAHTGGGLGIGLTLVRRLVDMHGGQVQAHSAGANAGSEFLVRLPLASRGGSLDPPASKGASSDSPAAEPAPPPSPRRRILVADDNGDAADSLSLILQMAGHDTRVARDGDEAWRIAREFRPDTLVLDIAMPGLGGLELARLIRAETWGGPVLLIAASGWGQADDKKRSREAGFDHHLVKPVAFVALDKLLREAAG